MKYALIADVHGNLPALEAVISDARAQGAQRYVFVGDYCISFPYPNEVVDVLRGLAPEVCVTGNGEDYFRRLEGSDPAGWTDGQMEITYYSFLQVTQENRRFLYALPAQASFTDEGHRVHVAHSSQDFIGDAEHARFACARVALRHREKAYTHESLLADVRATLAANEGLARRLSGMEDGVYIFGHSHIQWHARLGGKLLINPGSCGLPLDCAGSGAAYTLLTCSSEGVTAQERTVAYDEAALSRAVRTSEQYRHARVWSENILRELETRQGQTRFFLSFVEAFAKEKGDAVRPFTKATWEAAYEDFCRRRRDATEGEGCR